MELYIYMGGMYVCELSLNKAVKNSMKPGCNSTSLVLKSPKCLHLSLDWDRTPGMVWAAHTCHLHPEHPTSDNAAYEAVSSFDSHITMSTLNYITRFTPALLHFYLILSPSNSM